MSKGNEEAARLRRLLVDLQHPSFASSGAENIIKDVQGLNAGQQEAIKRYGQKDSLLNSDWQFYTDKGCFNMVANVALHLGQFRL